MTDVSDVPLPASTVREAAAAQLVLRLSTGYVASAAIHVIIELGIADRLASGPRPVVDLAAETGVSADALHRVMRTLASVGLFRETAAGVFALNPAAALLRDVPGSLRGPSRLMAHPFQFRVFADFSSAVRTGRSAAEAVFNRPFFEVLADDPELSRLFNDGMTGMSVAVNDALVSQCPLTDARLVVDVGGGHGALLASVLRAWPNVRGLLFDAERVVAGADEVLASAGVHDRCQCVGGNFFEHVPAGGDVYLLKHVLHDWPDAQAAAILRNVRTAMGANPRGRLLVIEAVLEEGSSMGGFTDLSMLALVGGRERTAAQFAPLLDQAGFELVRILPTRSFLSVIEARPRERSA